MLNISLNSFFQNQRNETTDCPVDVIQHYASLLFPANQIVSKQRSYSYITRISATLRQALDVT
jgi:hypothetical protein